MAPLFLPPEFVSLLLKYVLTFGWLLAGWLLSHSISSSRAATVASAFGGAFLTLARLLSIKDSLLPLLGVCFLGVRHPLARNLLLSLVSSFVSALGGHQRKTPPPPSILVLPVEIQEVSTACIPPGTKTVILPGWYEGLPAGWQISPPKGPALVTPFNDLSRLFAPPSFVLALWHDRTFCRASLDGGDYLPPTLPVPPGTALHPLPSWLLIQTSPPWLPALWWLEPCPSYSHIFQSLIYGIYRKLRNITML